MCALATASGLQLVHKHGGISRPVPASLPGRRHGGDAHPLARTLHAIDFQPGHADLVLVAGRSPHAVLADLRAPHTAWQRVGTGCPAVAHARFLSPHAFAGAGIADTLAVWDVRFASARRTLGRGTADGPVLRFPGYRNAAHAREVGFDVCPELGLVTAARDDGTVGLWSAETGSALPWPAMDGRPERRVVKALHFATVPADRGVPSLWVGAGQAILKYSVGRENGEDDDL
jgi:hypothetical protein